MTGKLSQAQRKQVIDDYLEGVLTLEYKVKELDDGKFRVSRRSDKEIQQMREEYNLKDLEKSENNNENQTEEEDVDEEKEPKPESENSELTPETADGAKLPGTFGSDKKPTKPQVKQAPKPALSKPRSAPRNEVIESLHQTNQEILNHLRLLGEEKARKRQKKEVKREVKHRINKIYKEPVEQDEYEEEDERERIIIIQKPQYQRRRLNLLND
jgi:hypothetical protein